VENGTFLQTKGKIEGKEALHPHQYALFTGSLDYQSIISGVLCYHQIIIL